MITTIKTALFIDTNILIYATHSLSPWQPIAIQTLHEARESNIDLTVSPQVLREYLAVATRDQSIPREKIFENINLFQREFTLLNEHSETFTHLLNLLKIFPTSGKQVHDANIVATMLTHHILYLLTHNVTDFARFAKIIQIKLLVG